jgi:hypothetical protein
MLSINRIKLVRMGHPARLLPQVLDSSLDAQVWSFQFLINHAFLVVQSHLFEYYRCLFSMFLSTV